MTFGLGPVRCELSCVTAGPAARRMYILDYCPASPLDFFDAFMNVFLNMSVRVHYSSLRTPEQRSVLLVHRGKTEHHLTKAQPLPPRVDHRGKTLPPNRQVCTVYTLYCLQGEQESIFPPLNLPHVQGRECISTP